MTSPVPCDVRFRLLRRGDEPATNPLALAYVFGLQDSRQEIVPGQRCSDGTFVFDFSLRAKPGRDADHPAFTGRFASGPVHDRFVYLSWRAVDDGHYINRVKARLSAIDWVLVRQARAGDKPLTADMTGWRPGDARRQVVWSIP